MSISKGTVDIYLDDSDLAKLMTLSLVEGMPPGTYLRRRLVQRFMALAAGRKGGDSQ